MYLRWNMITKGRLKRWFGKHAKNRENRIETLNPLLVSEDICLSKFSWKNRPDTIVLLIIIGQL